MNKHSIILAIKDALDKNIINDADLLELISEEYAHNETMTHIDSEKQTKNGVSF